MTVGYDYQVSIAHVFSISVIIIAIRPNITITIIYVKKNRTAVTCVAQTACLAISFNCCYFIICIIIFCFYFNTTKNSLHKWMMLWHQNQYHPINFFLFLFYCIINVTDSRFDSDNCESPILCFRVQSGNNRF